MKNLWKHLLAVAVAALALVALAVPAMAVETTVNLTVTAPSTVTGTVTAVQLFSVNNGAYEATSDVFGYFMTSYLPGGGVDTSGTVPSDGPGYADSIQQYLNKLKTGSPRFLQDVAKAAAFGIKNGSGSGYIINGILANCPTTQHKTEILSGGSAAFSNLPIGYYLVYINDTMPAVLQEVNSTNTSIDFSDKPNKPAVTATATAGTEENKQVVAADMGEDVIITLSTVIPSAVGYTSGGAGGYILTFEDTLPKGLTFKNLKRAFYTTGATSTNLEGCTPTVATSGGKVTIELGEKLFAAKDQWTANESTVTVELTVGVNKDANVTGLTAVAGRLGGNVNSAVVKYSYAPNTSLGTSAPATTTVYTFGLTINAVSEDGSAQLADAKFVLSSDADGSTKYYSKDATSGAVSWVDNKDNATPLTTAMKSGKAVVDVTGLDAGTYTLEETASPFGYEKLNSADDAGKIVITPTYNSAQTALQSWTVQVGKDVPQTDNSTVLIKHTKAAALPETGAIGTAVFIVLGVAAVIVGVVIIDRKRGRV